MRVSDATLVHPMERERALDLVANAFAQDPVWTWAFPEHDGRRRFMGLLVDASLRFPAIFRTTGFEAVAVWTPPGESELSPEQENAVPSLLDSLVGPRASEVAEMLHRFEQSHPRAQPHWYLGVLGVDMRHRGHGFGMSLLQRCLDSIDPYRQPVYLESSNPSNNARYEALGFRPIVSFQVCDHGPTVTGMWREKTV